ncbi:hypothetical protein IJ541_01760 [bacterium]|nr:hypothetical protein [bacterium]MBQ9245513.1 hypothetical protein [bacterium]
MTIIIILLIVLILFIAMIVNGADSRYTNNYIVDNALKDLINVQKIEECAKDIRQKEGVTKNESIYFAICSLMMLIGNQPGINKIAALRVLHDIIKNEYQNIFPIIENYKEDDFDFIEHIALNAKHIVEEEGKDRNEALYLTICMFYDDLTQKGSQNGIKELMKIVNIIYTDLLNDVMTYVAWKYQPQLVFKPEFDEYMRKRHSK